MLCGGWGSRRKACLPLHKAGKCSHTWPPTSKGVEQPACRLAGPACSGWCLLLWSGLAVPQPLGWSTTDACRHLAAAEALPRNKPLTDRVHPDEGIPHGGHGLGAPGQLHPKAACRSRCPCQCRRGPQVGSWGVCMSDVHVQGVLVDLLRQLDCVSSPGAATDGICRRDTASAHKPDTRAQSRSQREVAYQ